MPPPNAQDEERVFLRLLNPLVGPGSGANGELGRKLVLLILGVGRSEGGANGLRITCKPVNDPQGHERALSGAFAGWLARKLITKGCFSYFR
jgi:hypothetical protein